MHKISFLSFGSLRLIKKMSYRALTENDKVRRENIEIVHLKKCRREVIELEVGMAHTMNSRSAGREKKKAFSDITWHIYLFSHEKKFVITYNNNPENALCHWFAIIFFISSLFYRNSGKASFK